MRKWIDLNEMKKKINLTEKRKTTLARAGMLSLLLVLVAFAVVYGERMEGEGRATASDRAVLNVGRVSEETTLPAEQADESEKEVAAPTAQPQKSDSGLNYFEAFRQDRARLRDKQLLLFDEAIAASPNGETAIEAAKQKLALTKRMEAEFLIEQELLAKGFAEAVCIVRDDTATVAVKKPTLTDAESAMILTAALEATGLRADDVKVIPVP